MQKYAADNLRNLGKAKTARLGGSVVYLASDVDAYRESAATEFAVRDTRIADLERDLLLANDAAAKGEAARLNAAGMEGRIAELEQRLIACETALLMAAAGSVPDTAAYMARYPEPYSAS